MSKGTEEPTGLSAWPDFDYTQQDDVSPLQASMNMADVIVQSQRDFDPTLDDPTSPTSWKVAPGFVEGLVAGAGSLALLVPLGKVLKVSKNPVTLGIYTIAQLTASMYSSIYVGSTYGGYVWLQKLAQLDPSTPSPSADQVCTNTRTLNSIRDFSSLDVSDNPSWTNPHDMVLIEFKKCLQHCQERNDLNEQTRRQKEESKVPASQSKRSTFSRWWSG